VTQAQIDQFDELGFFVLDDIYSSEELAELTRITDEAEDEAIAELKKQADERFLISENGAITFAAQIVRQKPEIRPFVRNAKILGVCADLIGPNVRMYHDQAVYKMTEKPRRFPWHQDNGYLYVEPQHYLTCWIALTDATIDNGCPQVVPGLHKDGTLAHYYVDTLGFECFEEPPTAPVIAEVKAGGAVFFSSLTPHLTGPNFSNSTRKAYIVQYASSDARVLEGSADAGAATGSHAISDEPRGIAVLENGVPVV
jgi:ectoine hydroxylase-related dioxygenase (phytanoyl-CoA dioxygenase family)